MKKIVFEKTSEIHLKHVSKSDIIIVKKKGVVSGTIAHNGEHWCGISSGSGQHIMFYLFEVCTWFGADCEFFIFE